MEIERAMPGATDGRFLAGLHAVVTGGGRGIGAAIAAELAGLGAAVSLMGRDVARLEATAATLRSRFGVEVVAVPCDVGSAASVAAAFAAGRERLGDPDVLVNNAGQAVAARFDETPLEQWEAMLTVNATGTFLCTQQALPAMIARGSGRIVNVASTAGLKGYPHVAAYCAAKHAVIGLTRALALETAKLGITVNAVCPGYTDTDMALAAAETVAAATGKSREDALRSLARTNPRGTLIRPEEVASTVGWLCSPAASAVTGQAIVVAAGEVMAG